MTKYYLPHLVKITPPPNLIQDSDFIIENLLKGGQKTPTIKFVPTRQKVFELEAVCFVGEQSQNDQFYFENSNTLCVKRYAGNILVPTDAAIYGHNIQTDLRGVINFHGYLHQSNGDIHLYSAKDVPLKLQLSAKKGIFIDEVKQRKNDDVPILTNEYFQKRWGRRAPKILGIKMTPNIETALHYACRYDLLALRTDSGSIRITRIPEDEIPYFKFL